MTDIAVCPGSFDPVTLGHLDVIERAATRFERVVVACLRNIGKSPLLEPEERIDLLRAATEHVANVRIEAFDGLLVDFCRAQGATTIVKGLRAASDFENELKMAQMNAALGGVETLFMATNPRYSYLSSSLVKEVARFRGDIGAFVPQVVARRLRERSADGS